MMNQQPRRRKILASCALIALLAAAGCSSGVSRDEIDPSKPAAGMLSLAESLRDRGDYVGAADFYQRAERIDPDDALVRRGYAAALEKTGHVDEAAEEYKKAFSLNPDDNGSRRNLGRLYLRQDKAAQARDVYQAALENDSGDFKAMNGLAISLDYLGDHASAQKYFKKALERDSGNLTTVNNLAYSLIKDGKLSEAIHLLEPKMKEKEATPALRQNLALAYGLSGMDADAERVAKMDLPAAKVKENLAYYKKQRAERAVDTAPYAEVGTYATQAMAEAEIARMQAHLDEAGIDLKPVIAPQVGAPGGTPRFEVRMMGCAKPDDVKVFCDQLAKNGLPCMVRNDR